jgi:hypothetical protein
MLRAAWSRWSGLDFHVAYTILARGWMVLAGGCTVLLLPLCLDATEQGYYFTFASLLTLQVFFELGLNQIVVQLVSHEAAHLTQDAEGRWHGPPQHMARLAALLRLMRRWYAIAALAFAVVAGVAGWLFFTTQASASPAQWGGPWLAVVLSTALNLLSSPGLAASEGLGHVGQVARLRLIQSMLGYGLMWLGLLLGAGLWCSVAVPLSSGLVTWYWLRTQARFPQSPEVLEAGPPMRWRTDVFPLQWRTAVSWISGFFIFNLFTPLTFSIWGAQEAGRLGMALTIFGSITAIGMSWVNARFPMMGACIARGERGELNSIFAAVAKRAVAFNALVCGLFLAVIGGLQGLQLPWVHRLADWNVLCVLAALAVLNTAIFSMATYMRAHREEPMLTLSVVMGSAVGVATVWSVAHGVSVMMLMYLLLNAVVSLPWTVTLWKTYARRNA